MNRSKLSIKDIITGLAGTLVFFIFILIALYKNEMPNIDPMQGALSHGTAPSVGSNAEVKNAYLEMKEKYYKSLAEEQNKISNDISQRINVKITDKLDEALGIDYLNIVKKVSKEYKIPTWFLIGEHAYYANGITLKNPIVPKLEVPMGIYGSQIEKEDTDESVITNDANKIKYHTFETINENIIDKYNEKNETEDVFNSKYIINLPSKYEKVDYIFKNPEDDYKEKSEKDKKDNFSLELNMERIAKYHSNNEAFFKKIKLSNISWLNDEILAVTDENSRSEMISYLQSNESIAYKLLDRSRFNVDNILQSYLEGDIKGNSEIIKLWVDNGWKLNKKSLDYLIEKDIKINTGNENEIMSQEYGEVPQLIYENNGKSIRIDLKNALYVSKVYSLGTSINNELNYKLSDNKLNQNLQNLLSKSVRFGDFSPLELEFNQVKYFWELKNSDINKDKRLIEGKLGEAGYKGYFPIFIQSPGLNEVSRIPWKFNGSDTSLGKAGCSLFSLTSLLQAAGYGDYDIPGTNLKPNIDNLARVFPNGPIIGNYVSAKGYTIRYRSTNTKKDLYQLFEDLKAGIPYVVNVKSGSINGYKANGEIVKTEFTFGGHFLIFSSAFEKDGKKYVEVVQSSRGNAGTKKIDQNQMIFDFDELIDKKIIRTSMGYAVPAYTIVGGPGLPTPRYLDPRYIQPRTTIIGQNNDMELGNIISEENIAIRNKAIKDGKNFDRIKDIIKQLDITEDKLVTTNRLKQGIEIINTTDDLLVSVEKTSPVTTTLLIFIDYNNAIQITNLVNALEKSEVLEKGSVMGTTSEYSSVRFVTRVSGDNWMILDANKIEVTAE